jgi:hypothetical protein
LACGGDTGANCGAGSEAIRKGFYDHPDQAAGWIENLIVTFAQAPGVVPSTIFLTGLTVGAWLDWFARQIDGTRASRRGSVGLEFQEWADIVQRRISPPF